MELTLSDALSLKKRVLQRKKSAMDLIKSENSKIEGGKRKCDVAQMLCMYTACIDLLINLKTAIAGANVGIRKDIESLSEIKSTIVELRSISTSDGVVEGQGRMFGGEATVSKTAVLKHSDIEDLVLTSEKNMDTIQRRLNKYNASTTIKVKIPEILEEAGWITANS